MGRGGGRGEITKCLGLPGPLEGPIGLRITCVDMGVRGCGGGGWQEATMRCALANIQSSRICGGQGVVLLGVRIVRKCALPSARKILKGFAHEAKGEGGGAGAVSHTQRAMQQEFALLLRTRQVPRYAWTHICADGLLADDIARAHARGLVR